MVYQNAASALGKIGTEGADRALISYLEKNYSDQAFYESELRVGAEQRLLATLSTRKPLTY